MIHNLIIFLLLSLFYLHVIHSLKVGVSAFDFVHFKQLIKSERLLVMFTFLTLLLVTKVYNVSKYFVMAQYAVILYYSISIYLDDFNKLILLLVFVYALFGGYFGLFWFLELGEAIYGPNYSHLTIGPRQIYDIPVSLELNNQSEIFKGHLSNWDARTCFIVTEREDISTAKGKGTLWVHYEGNQFCSEVEVCTSYDKGLGLKFTPTTNFASSDRIIHDWNELYRLLKDRGFKT